MMVCGRQEAKEPLFCLETAVKLLAWSWLVYKDSPAPCKADALKEVSASEGSEPTEVSDSEQARLGMSWHCLSLRCTDLSRLHAWCVQVSQQSPEPTEKQPEEGDAALAQAMGMYGLQHTHVIHEKDPDTKVRFTAHRQVTCSSYQGFLLCLCPACRC
jgi:hypothetical protein